MKRSLTLVLLALGMGLAAAQCSTAPAEQGSAASIKVMAPWTRAAVSGSNGAVYLKLMNEGGNADVLLSAYTAVAEVVEIHQTKIDEHEVMQMVPIGRIEVPAGSSVSLEPGGKHIMLINLKQDLKPGEKITVTFNFEQSGPITLEADIREGGAVGGHGMEQAEPAHGAEHGEHDHDSGEKH
jgi:hypothetical protein